MYVYVIIRYSKVVQYFMLLFCGGGWVVVYD